MRALRGFVAPDPSDGSHSLLQARRLRETPRLDWRPVDAASRSRTIQSNEVEDVFTRGELTIASHPMERYAG